MPNDFILICVHDIMTCTKNFDKKTERLTRFLCYIRGCSAVIVLEEEEEESVTEQYNNITF